MRFPTLSLIAVVVLACTDTPTVVEPEPDCSSPWATATAGGVVHLIGGPPDYYLHESDLPYSLAAEGIGADDQVTVKDENRPQRMTAYQEGGAWMIRLEPDANWYGEGHLVEQLLASRPGCDETHAAVLLLFRGEAPSQ